MKKKIILGLAATAAIAAPLAFTAGAANAYTIDAAGKGFVGKGEVQSAFNLNNVKMQAAVDAAAFTFTAEVPTTRSLSQSVTQTAMQVGSQAGVQTATQTATQSGTVVVSQDLTCEFTNGSGTKTFHRDGIREGDRTGTREGTREGSRYAARFGERTGERTGTQAGKQSGKITSALNVTDKKTGQYTGFNLKGFTGNPLYSEVGSPVWDAPTFGGLSFGGYTYKAWEYFGDFAFGGYTFGDYTFEGDSGVEWGEWDALPGENPDDCLRSQNADHITQISNIVTDEDTVTDGAIVDGPVTEHDTTPFMSFDMQTTPTGVTYGAITSGSIIAGTPAQVYVSNNGGTPKALTSEPLIHPHQQRPRLTQPGASLIGQ